MEQAETGRPRGAQGRLGLLTQLGQAQSVGGEAQAGRLLGCSWRGPRRRAERRRGSTCGGNGPCEAEARRPPRITKQGRGLGTSIGRMQRTPMRNEQLTAGTERRLVAGDGSRPDPGGRGDKGSERWPEIHGGVPWR